MEPRGGGSVGHPDLGRGTQAPLQGQGGVSPGDFSPPPNTVFPPLSFRHMQAKCNTHGVSAISKYRTKNLQGMQDRAPHVPTESTHGTSKRAFSVPFFFFFFFSSFHFWKQKANTCESFLGNYDWKTLRHVSFQIYRMLPEINT